MDKHDKGWIEEIELAGSQLVGRVKELFAEGSVRRIRVRSSDGELILDMPLNLGAIAGGAVTLAAPGLALVAALAGLVTRVKLEVVRDGEPPRANAGKGAE